MLEAPVALKNYMATGNPNVVAVELVTIALSGGTTLRYTTGYSQVTAAASLFPANSPLNGTGGPFTFAVGPPIDRIKMAPRKIGLEGQECDVVVHPRPTDLIGNQTWQEYAFGEQFDGADIEVGRFHWSGDGLLTPLGAFILAYGYVANVDVGRSTLTLHAKTLPGLLDQPAPRRLYQAACGFVFGGPMCLFNKTAPLTTFACGGGSTTTSLTGTGLGTTHVYDNALCLGLTGVNAGQVVLVSTIAGGTVSVVSQTYNGSLPSTPSPGDTFQLGSAATVTAAAGSTQSSIITTFGGAGQSYTQGTIIGLTGANEGISRTVGQFTGGIASLMRNFPSAVSVGDTFTLLPGCPHTLTGCQVFANLLHFGGTPYIPPPEESL